MYILWGSPPTFTLLFAILGIPSPFRPYVIFEKLPGHLLRIQCYQTSILVDGNWGAWSEATPCNKSCGYGYKHRYRKCDNPAPTYGGEYCRGPSVDVIPECNVQQCPGIFLLLVIFLTTAVFNGKLVHRKVLLFVVSCKLFTTLIYEQNW